MFKKPKLRDRKGLIHMTYLLVFINAGIFLLQLILPTFTNLFALYPVGSESYWVFQYFTATFLHANFMHLLMNMLGLYFFGVFLETKFGRINFLTLYIVSGLLANILWHVFYTPLMPVLGASGSIFGIITVLALLIPNQKILVFFVIPMKLWWGFALIMLYTVYKVINPADNVGHFIHLMGALVGAVYYILFLRKGTHLSNYNYLKNSRYPKNTSSSRRTSSSSIRKRYKSDR